MAQKKNKCDIYDADWVLGLGFRLGLRLGFRLGFRSILGAYQFKNIKFNLYIFLHAYVIEFRRV